MDGFTIEHSFIKDSLCSQYFRGIFSSDEIPISMPSNAFFVYNTSRKDDSIGRHWVCIKGVPKKGHSVVEWKSRANAEKKRNREKQRKKEEKKRRKEKKRKEKKRKEKREKKARGGPVLVIYHV